jgi:hypothetical protein
MAAFSSRSHFAEKTFFFYRSAFADMDSGSNDRQPGARGLSSIHGEISLLAALAEVGQGLTRPTKSGLHMSIFSSILSKLGLGDAKAEVAAQAEPGASTEARPASASAAAPAVAAISAVDVVSKLELLAASHAEKLNWKVSIVDLLKLLGLESSLHSRQELAKELNCPAEKMADSAQMNTWLHQSVLQKLAQNGGNIPADLLH